MHLSGHRFDTIFERMTFPRYSYYRVDNSSAQSEKNLINHTNKISLFCIQMFFGTIYYQVTKKFMKETSSRVVLFEARNARFTLFNFHIEVQGRSEYI